MTGPEANLVIMSYVKLVDKRGRLFGELFSWRRINVSSFPELFKEYFPTPATEAVAILCSVFGS